MTLPSMPGLGDVPPMADRVLKETFERAQANARQERRELAARKKELWDETFHSQIEESIRTRWQNSLIRKRMSRFITVELNAAKDITRAVAVAYDYGVRRLLHGANEELETNWRSLLQEGGIDGQAPSWLRFAFLQGQPPIVVPVVKHGRLVREIKLAHEYDVVTDPADPSGPPESVIWEVGDGTNTDQGNDKRVRWVVVDREVWRYYNREGRPVVGPAGKKVVEHGCRDEKGVQRCPAVPIRLEAPVAEDPWWGGFPNQRLLEGSINIAVLWTRLRFVRKSRDIKLLSLFGPRESSMPPGQLLSDPEGALRVFSDQAGALKLEAHDVVVDPAQAIGEIMFEYSNLVQAYGIPPSSITWQYSGGSQGMETVTPVATIQATRERLNHLRAGQIRFLDPAERTMAVYSAAMVRSLKHPLWSKIPKPDEVADQFTIEWQEIDTIADPKERRNQDDWDHKHGLISRVDFAQRKHTNLSRRAALELIKRNVEEDSEVNEILAERNQPLGGAVAPTTAQVNGTMGPLVRDGKVRPDGRANPKPPPSSEGT